MQDEIDAGNPATTSTLVDEVAKKLHEAIDRITVHANAAEERVLSATRTMEGALKSSSRTAAEKAGDLTSGVKDYVDEHPLTSLGIAFGAGLLLAALLRRE